MKRMCRNAHFLCPNVAHMSKFFLNELCLAQKEFLLSVFSQMIGMKDFNSFSQTFRTSCIA